MKLYIGGYKNIRLVVGLKKTLFFVFFLLLLADFVVVINADKVSLSGDKWNQKEYISYSGYTGGQKRILAKDLMSKKPTAMVEKAVKGMLPKTKLGNAIWKNLFVYAGAEHPHAAQKPKTLNI